MRRATDAATERNMAAPADMFAKTTLERSRTGRLFLTIGGKTIGEVEQVTESRVTVSVPTPAVTFAASDGSFHRATPPLTDDRGRGGVKVSGEQARRPAPTSRA